MWHYMDRSPRRRLPRVKFFSQSYYNEQRKGAYIYTPRATDFQRYRNIDLDVLQLKCTTLQHQFRSS